VFTTYLSSLSCLPHSKISPELSHICMQVYGNIFGANHFYDLDSYFFYIPILFQPEFEVSSETSVIKVTSMHFYLDYFKMCCIIGHDLFLQNLSAVTYVFLHNLRFFFLFLSCLHEPNF
jgi:hypothetical protein